jgi:sugar O-acyltransferase (sialic acid O-acetyltransferase NeuD family)
MTKDIVIFGTGSFAQLAYFYFTNDSTHKVHAFTVNLSHKKEDELFGLPVIPFEELTMKFPPNKFGIFIAIGYTGLNKIRACIYSIVKEKGYELATYISPKCTYYGERIGDNCFVFEDNTIQPFVKIGNNVILWSGNHIGHHSIIGDHCFISSHVVISGHVTVSPYCFFGVNSTVRDSVSIGESCIIGAGSLIMKNTKSNEVFITKRTFASKRQSADIDI